MLEMNVRNVISTLVQPVISSQRYLELDLKVSLTK